MRPAISLVAGLLLGGCSILGSETQRGYETTAGWNTAAVFTTADVRMISQRQHPVMKNTVICTEPSPDVAKALSSAASLTGQGGNGAVTAGAGFSAAAAEALAELAGRSTALLGLRDGLYRACEAYANGIIGQDAYSLVLSRYGQLMTTLFLAQDVTGAAGAEGKAAATSAALQLQGAQQNTGSGTQSGNSKSTGKSASAGGSNSGTTPTSASAPETPLPPQVILAVASALGLPPEIVPVADLTPTPAPATPPANNPANPSNGDATKPSTGGTTGNNTPSQSGAPATAAAVSTAGVLVLGRMNEDYFNLDSSLLHLLVVACINEHDPTRLQVPLPGGAPTQNQAARTAVTTSTASTRNDWLEKRCDELNLQKIEQIEATLAASAAAFKPINPEVAAQSSGGTSGSKTPSGGQTAPKSDPVILAVQKALAKANCPGCNPGTPDGIDGPKTRSAVAAYQKANNLAVNGNPKDPKTMQSLGVNNQAAAGPSGAAI